MFGIIKEMGDEIMFENIENLKFDSAIHKVSKPYAAVTDRAKHSFNIRVIDSMDYDFGDRSFTVKADEAIFIPKGSNLSLQSILRG